MFHLNQTLFGGLKMPKKIRLLKWSVTFGIISLIVLFFFIFALRSLLSTYIEQYALLIAIITGILLVIFIAMGTLSIKSIIKKFT